MKQKYLSLTLGLLLALPLAAQQNHNFEVSKQLDIFNKIYKSLDLYYVDTLNAEQRVGDAIGYMLEGLDPYTEYYNEQDASQLETMTTGKYAGIGSIIGYNKKYDRCVVKEPYENQPAANAGVRQGDVILSIDGKAIDKKGDTPTDKYTASISNALRGDPDTEIVLVVDRPGVGEMTFQFRRASIQMPAVAYSSMLTDTTGYIVLSTFTRDCSQEVKRALRQLKEQGARNLVLDLRGNGGGLAIEAVNVVNLFVPKDKLILQMKGKNKSANSSYSTRWQPEEPDMPVVVLVDGASASSSEITCGSLQDLDRAVIMGERTYGKGLVQQPRQLPYGGMLKLTTSHYYIPSGRCIQALDYSRRGQSGEVYRTPDSLTHEFRTAAGRIVRDGGGITPDVEVKQDSMPTLLAYLQNSYELSEYIALYRAKHDTIAPAATFTITDGDYEEFKQFLAGSDFTYDRQTYKALQELKKIARFEGYDRTAGDEIKALEAKLEHNLAQDLDAWKPYVVRLLNEEICRDRYFTRGAIENGLRDDRVVQAAVRLLRHPDEYRAILTPDK
ncbi:MAG: S41 family peptidase [Bacteroidaceae bacterium]|jgi:carboxyl-terminal processing protease|nr:S41 family peptidase [Bacteroidaceae bacterium]